MKKKCLVGAMLSIVMNLGMTTIANAAETDTIYVRAKAGPSFYSNVDPVSSVFGLGLDLGFRTASGFGLAGMAKLNFLGSAQDTSSPNVTIRTEVKSLFLGVIPSYSVNKGIATISFGLGIGVLSVTTQTDTFINSPSSTSSSPETSKSRFALAPSIDVDFDIISGLFANVGVQYVASFGESPKPSFISPMAGVGYRF